MYCVNCVSTSSKVHCVLCSVQYVNCNTSPTALHSLWVPEDTWTSFVPAYKLLPRPMYTVHCTLYSALYTIHHTLYTVHCRAVPRPCSSLPRPSWLQLHPHTQLGGAASVDSENLCGLLESLWTPRIWLIWISACSTCHRWTYKR